MRYLLSILVLLPSLAFGQASTVITNFGGLSGASDTDIPPGLHLDIVDFDYRASSASGAVSLIKRDGYVRVGDVQTGLTSGPWRFSSPTISSQLLAGFGRELRLYSTSEDAWLPINTNPFSDTCNCKAANDTVTSVYRKNWWGVSMEAYTTITIDGNLYNIERIMGDSLIILSGHGGAGADSLPAATHTRVPCQITTTGTAGQSAIFTNASDPKYGIMFEDTLHVITPWEHVKYGGRAAVATTSPLSFTSISAWDRANGTVTLSGASGIPVGSWAQVGPLKNYDLNIALYATAQTGNSNTFRIDTAGWNWLYTNADSLWWFKQISAVTWTKFLSSTVTTVAKDSIFAYGEVVSTSQQNMLVEQGTAGGASISNVRMRRNVTVKKPVYLFRWKVSNTSVANAPEVWPQDTLDYMTVVADNEDSAAGQKRSQGFYSRQFPVTIGPAIATETTLVITTLGYAGGTGGSSDSTYIDSSAWWFVPGGFGGTLCGFSFTGATTEDSMQIRPVVAVDGNRYVHFVYPLDQSADKCCRHGSGSSCQVREVNSVPVCSLKVKCGAPAAYSPVPIASNGANDCYQVGDSLFLYRMGRLARTSMDSTLKIQDTTGTRGVAGTADSLSWDWGYCISALGRFFCIDNQERTGRASTNHVAFKNRVYWSAPNNPDSFGVADFDQVFTDDGQIITTIAVEQSVVYVHKPTAIYTMPMIVSPDGLSVEPAGIFPTRSRYGALSPDGLVGTPYGWYFVGFNGVYQHSGGDSEMISREIRWFWRDSLEAAQIVNASIAYDSHRDRLIVAVARKGSTVNNYTLVYDFATQQWGRYSFGAHHFQVLSYPTNNPQLYWADKDATTGGVFRMEEGLTTDMGAAILPYFTTGWLTLANKPTERVDLQEWYMQNRRVSGGSVALSVYVDGATTPVIVDTVTSSDGGFQLDRSHFPVGIGGNRFQMKMQSIVGDTCEVTAFGVDYLPGAEVAPR